MAPADGKQRAPIQLDDLTIRKRLPKQFAEYMARKRAEGKAPTEWKVKDAGAPFLYLVVTKKKSGLSYRWRCVKQPDKVHPKQIIQSLGGWPDVGIPAAREKARAFAAKVAEGINPAEEKRRVQAEKEESEKRSKLEGVTFKEAASEMLTTNAERMPKRWGPNSEAARKAEINLRLHILPVIGDAPVRLLTWRQVAEVMERNRLIVEHPDVARQCRTLINQVCTRAQERGIRDYEALPPARLDGPLQSRLQPILDEREVRDTHRPALAPVQVPEFMRELRTMPGISARALEFCILTAARPGQIIRAARNRDRRPYDGATWGDVDRNERCWNVPAIGMKEFQPFRCYLSSYALKLLDGLERLTLDNGELSPILFPSGLKPWQGLSDGALTAVIRRMNAMRQESGFPPWIDLQQSNLRERQAVITVHAFRASFRTWAADEEHGNYERYGITAPEVALSHKPKGDRYNGAYNRPELQSNLIPRLRRLMEDWGRYCMEGKWPDEE